MQNYEDDDDDDMPLKTMVQKRRQAQQQRTESCNSNQETVSSAGDGKLEEIQSVETTPSKDTQSPGVCSKMEGTDPVKEDTVIRPTAPPIGADRDLPPDENKRGERMNLSTPPAAESLATRNPELAASKVPENEEWAKQDLSQTSDMKLRTTEAPQTLIEDRTQLEAAVDDNSILVGGRQEDTAIEGKSEAAASSTPEGTSAGSSFAATHSVQEKRQDMSKLEGSGTLESVVIPESLTKSRSDMATEETTSRVDSAEAITPVELSALSVDFVAPTDRAGSDGLTTAVPVPLDVDTNVVTSPTATGNARTSALRTSSRARLSKSNSSPLVRFEHDHPRLPDSFLRPLVPRDPAWDQVEAFFPAAIKRRMKAPSSFSRTKRPRSESVVINITTKKDSEKPRGQTLSQPGEPELPSVIRPTSTIANTASVPHDLVQHDLSDPNGEFEDSILFFAETHEDQDPSYIQRERSKKRQKLESQLEHLKDEAESGKKEIVQRLAAQLKEKQDSHDRNRQRVLDERAADEKRHQQKYVQLYSEKFAANKRKIEENIQMLIGRHSQEMRDALREHRENAKQRSVPEQMATAEWVAVSQRLEVKQKQRLDSLRVRGEQIKERLQNDLDRELEKIRTHFASLISDASALMEKMLNDVKANISEQRDHLVKSHMDRIRKQRDKLRAQMHEFSGPSDAAGRRPHASKPRSLADLVKERLNKEEFRTASPITLGTDVGKECKGEQVGAGLRHKQRKTVLNGMPKQLSLEIHNEGLWMSSFLSENDMRSGSGDRGTRDESTDAAFIPWGLEAQRVLESVCCGEIPAGYGSERFKFSPLASANGGHVRCVVVDMRVSETTASSERARGLVDEEESTVQALEKSIGKLSETIAMAQKKHARASANGMECTTAVDKAVQMVSRAEQNLRELRAKAKNYIGPDDVPLASISSSEREKVSRAMIRHKSNIQGAMNRFELTKKALKEAKEHAQKMQRILTQAQRALSTTTASLKKRKARLQERAGGHQGRSRPRISEAAEAEWAAARVGDIVSAFGRVTKTRQEHFDDKRARGSAGWLQEVPGLPLAVKRNLQLRMGRHRQHIVLRPNMDDTLNAFKTSVKNLPLDSVKRNQAATEDSTVRAEQLFLVAAYPEVGSERVRSAPSHQSHYSSEPWAEPGWLVDLTVQENASGSDSLLPSVPAFESLQQKICENLSSQGRQSASSLRHSHLSRGLSQPLTVLGQTTSLAEQSRSTPGEEPVYTDADPLAPNESDQLIGYTFHRRSPTKVSSSARKKAAANDYLEALSSMSPKKQSRLESTQSKRTSPVGTPAPRWGSAKAEKPKPSRSRASTGSESAIRPAPARKSAKADGRSRPIIQPPTTILEQTRGSPLSARPHFGQQSTTQQSADQRTVSQYGGSYMSQPSSQSTQLRQLLSQQQQYASPQQLRQMAQFRLMHQQQRPSSVQPAFSPGAPQPQLQFFPQMMPPPQGVARQGSFQGQQSPIQFPAGRQHEYPLQAPIDVQRGSDSNPPHDPLHMLKDPPSKPN